MRENREIDRGLLKYLLLLQTVFPAVCDMGIDESVADWGNAPMQGRAKAG